MRFEKGEEGQGLVEYALILVLVAIVVIVILNVLGPQIGGVYARVMGGLNGQVVDGVGREAVVLEKYSKSAAGSTLCTYTVTDATVIILEDGRGVPNASVLLQMVLGGVARDTGVTGQTNGSGIVDGSKSFNVTGPCAGEPSYTWTGS